jgi:HlyD family secretion protein
MSQPGDRPPRRRLGARSLGACAALLLALQSTGCGGDDEESLGPTGKALRGRLERIVVATGTIEPIREVEVRPRIAGIIEKIHVEAGDRVEPDQPLVEIERELLASQVREAEAALREARVELRFAGIDVQRSDELERGGATSAQKRDAAQARFERAQAQVARASAALETLSTTLSYATVRSPLAGRVLDVNVEEGSAVSPVTAVTGGTLLLSLAATDTLRLRGLVDENEVARVVLGQPARIRTEAFAGRSFTGVVSEIAPLGQRIQNVTYFELEIDITDPDAQKLRPRMSGDADIVVEVADNALFVPETALRYRGEQIYVDKVLRESAARVEPVDVAIGIVEGARVQVLSGLAEGDEVRLK